jgi:plastocyanin
LGFDEAITVRIATAVLASLVVGSMAAADGPQREHAAVTGVVSVIRRSKTAVDNGEIAIWLKPAGGPGGPGGMPLPRVRLTITQRNKRFEPGMVVVPVGASVDFPNLDPFFHNVFSMFDGKRFDLGLYEAGSSRSVSFTMPGVCYIFCNIHPEMSAVVVVVDTPYYGVTNRAGEFAIHNVPPGKYELFLWHERYKPESPKDFPREVSVSADGASVGVIRLVESDEVIAPHKNKYGRDYTPAPVSPVYKGD